VAIQDIKSKKDLAGLAPKGRFISTEAVKRVVGQIGETQKATREAFEAAIIADYDAQSAVERELVLRLAGLMWRLRRATTMETGLFEIQADHLRRLARQVHPASREVVYALFGPANENSFGRDPTLQGITNDMEDACRPVAKPTAESSASSSAPITVSAVSP
jgi:hypothetical protein